MHKLSSNKQADIHLGLALQGGGSYGAYTKGVLKALFNSRQFLNNRVSLDAVAGTSAGAMNGALLTYGINSGSPQKALKILDNFWNDVGHAGRFNGLLSTFNPLSTGWPNLPLNAQIGMKFLPSGFMTRQLKYSLQKYIPDWHKVRRGKTKLFVNAVHEDGKSGVRKHVVFSGKELNADTVAASGALEDFGGHIYNGEKYLDGAYWRNPCFADLKKQNLTDLMVITLQKQPEQGIRPIHQDTARNRLQRPGHTLLTSEIHNHLAYIHKYHPQVNLHVISLDVKKQWDDSSRMNTDPNWLARLEKKGYEDGLKWLRKHGNKLGKTSSYDRLQFSGFSNPPRP